MRQQQNQIKAVDIYAELKSKNDSGIILGSMLRWDDAVVAELGYHVRNMMFGFSYDVTTSTLSTGANGHGGIELSLNYIFSKSGGAANSSPSF